ncbi:hypothetical protein ACJX0J_005309, partial [Zea mays]
KVQQHLSIIEINCLYISCHNIFTSYHDIYNPRLPITRKSPGQLFACILLHICFCCSMFAFYFLEAFLIYNFMHFTQNIDTSNNYQRSTTSKRTKNTGPTGTNNSFSFISALSIALLLRSHGMH